MFLVVNVGIWLMFKAHYSRTEIWSYWAKSLFVQVVFHFFTSSFVSPPGLLVTGGWQDNSLCVLMFRIKKDSLTLQTQWVPTWWWTILSSPFLSFSRQYHLNSSTTNTTTDVPMDIYSGFSDFSSLNLPRNGDFSQVCVIRSSTTSPLFSGRPCCRGYTPSGVPFPGWCTPQLHPHPASFILCLTCVELRLI